MADRRFSVLVADPSEESREQCRETLEPEGYDVVAAESGREVIEITRSERIHLVVMDLQLPDYSGVEIYHAIKAIRDTFLPCIFTALRMTAGSIRDALDEDVVTILPKPVEQPRLVHAVEVSIRRFYRRPRGGTGDVPDIGRAQDEEEKR
jgi:CheY-like chemotaxis protein